MNYQPRNRGASHTNKIMAKKVNSVAAKQRWANKKKIEDLKNRDQVSMYGGLGKVGLDYEGKKGQENLLDANESGDNDDKNDYQIPAFSAQARELVRAKMRADAAEPSAEENSDDEMLAEGLD